MLFRLIILVSCFLLVAPAWAEDGEQAALEDIANALIQGDAKGAYGTQYYQSLPITADGKRLIRIYAQPYSRVVELVGRNLWYELQDTQPLRPVLREWMLEEYRREFPMLAFEFTEDPALANLYTLEARFVPNNKSGQRWSEDAYKETAANSMHAGIAGRRSMLINFNTLGNPWLAQAIARNKSAVLRATMLNEMFNGLSVRDFQDLDEGRLQPATRQWLNAHRAHLDDYTITRSGGPAEDEFLKPLDKILIRKLFGVGVQAQ